ncbi:MAG TPA: ABC transporter permease [Gemmatimonadaceae bacterium]|jgi:predicted permease
MRRVFRLPFDNDHISREVDEELAFHFEMRIQRLIAVGLTREAATAEALRQFGDVAPVRQSMVTLDEQRERARHRINMMSELQQDLFYALRTLRRNIGFTAIVVTALAIGIGANTAIFTLIDAVLVRTLPVAHPEQLVSIGNPARVSSLSQGSPRTDIMAMPVYKDLRANNQIFTDVLASGRAPRLDARIGDKSTGEFEHPRGRFISGNYFSVLGIKPLLGRAFDASMDDVVGSSPVLVMSHGYWTRRFHNDRSVLGSTILLDGVKMTIIGIMPPEFTGEIVGASPDVWIPLTMQDALRPNQKMLDDIGTSWLLVLGRMKPGVTLAQATKIVPSLIEQSIVSRANPDVARSFKASDKKYYVQSGSKGFSRVRTTFEAPLFTLMIGVALLLCIICANVANLLLARAISRGREMAVRLALGADRRRLVRQLLTESIVLAVLSAAVGLIVAWWGSRALVALAGGGGALNLTMDLPVLAFTLGVSVFAVALFGLAPALRASRVDLASTMRANAHAVAGSALGGRGQRAPLGKILIAGQVALSVVLLMGATMLVRSLRNLQSVDVGLDRDHLVIVDVDINSRGYKMNELYSFVRTVADRVSALPGIAAVTYSENGIFSGTDSGTNIEIPGFIAKTADDSSVAYDQVGSGYAKSIGARLVAGRDLGKIDEDRLPRTALVNQSFASFYFPGKTAIGQYLHVGDTIAVEIVGVIGDTRDHDLTTTPDRRVYYPYVHLRDTVNVGVPGSLRFEVRTSGDPTALVQTIRKTVAAVDPQLTIDGVDPLVSLMRGTIGEQRLVAQLATAFGVLALVLAAIGLYGVMTYAIARRTGEIGLRMALGAQRADVVTMVLFDALKLVAVGVIVGLPLAIASTRLLRTQLHDVAATDPLSIAVAIGVLATSAVVAVTIPAMRASKVSPIVALRAD